LKLKSRFTLVFAGLTILVVVLTEVFLFFSEKKQLMQKVEGELSESLGKFAGLCQESFITKNDILLINHLALLKKDPRLAFAAFIDVNGRILAHTETNLIGSSLSSDVGHDLNLKSEIISARGESIGRALVAYRHSTVEASINEVLSQDMRRFVGVAAVALAIALILGFYLAHSIAEPVGTVAAGALLLGTGKLDHRINIQRQDEIGVLAESFNHMAQKLQELDALKEEFVSMVSHELRSPLSGINGYVKILRQGGPGPVNERQQEFLGIIEQCSDRLTRLVNNILDLTKLETGMMEFDRKPFDMVQAGLEAIKLLTPEADKHQISLVLSMPHLPQVLADADSMKQVFINLAHNALKFTPEGGTITIWGRAENAVLRFGVTDTGVGIPPDKIGQLFKKFEQIQETKKHAKAKGTGLGLVIVKRLVEAHGSRIDVQSQLGQGTTFSFCLTPTTTPTFAGNTSRPAAHQLVRKRKILIVEDEPAIAQMVSYLLQDQGHHVMSVANGHDALQQFTIFKPELLLLDLVLPDMNGLDILQKIRASPVDQEFGAIIMTTVQNKLTKDRAAGLGVAAYLIKPFEPQDLIEAINRSDHSS
jgi:signal transduction histidine kinase/ActR/RegA family two-component response regulator